MSDPEWNAIRWAYRRTIVAHRRLLVVFCAGNLFLVALCITMLVVEQWIPLALTVAFTVIGVSRCPMLLRDLTDMEERLKWIESHW